MADLTPKRQFAALYMLGRHCGLWGGRVQLPETEALRGRVPVSELVLLFWIVVVSRDNVGRAAAMLLLDFYRPGWRTGLPDEALGFVVDREAPDVRHWRAAVLRRDGCCQRCGVTRHLQAHHIVHWAVAPPLRLALDNGLTLCAGCHSAEHHP